MMDFQEFPKIARLSREVIVTEKIDGTNGCILIKELDGCPETDPMCVYQNEGLALFCGSRTRWITPACDNHGFAAWAYSHAEELMSGLGPGRHFGEWWGAGIQRGYGLPKGEKRFSLFNVIRWCRHDEEPQRIETGDPSIEKYQTRLPVCCRLVPVLWRGLFDRADFDEILSELSAMGSYAAPGFMKPEGVVVYHVAGNVMFKKTLGNDGHKTAKK
jgi:hypothetical protein